MKTFWFWEVYNERKNHDSLPRTSPGWSRVFEGETASATIYLFIKDIKSNRIRIAQYENSVEKRSWVAWFTRVQLFSVSLVFSDHQHNSTLHFCPQPSFHSLYTSLDNLTHTYDFSCYLWVNRVLSLSGQKKKRRSYRRLKKWVPNIYT